ncbi:MAG: phosphoribosylglycinamide formyltransferase [Polyangiaceae bacterium]|nr:phosphoribosylglycinamide formyltransferase [Polyangiaceae bacterium]
MKALCVLASGEGTNLQAILDACASGELRARVALVGSDRPGARALERAAAARVPTVVSRPKDHASREAHDAVFVEAAAAHGAEVVVLAGYMRLVTRTLLDAFPDRVVNVHPALLPAFPGTDGLGDALAHGATIAGTTVHLVDAGVDTGPILAQAAVPIVDGDTKATLAARVRPLEHALLLRALGWLVEGRVTVTREEGRRPRVRVEGVAARGVLALDA